MKGFSGIEGIELLFATPKDLMDFEFEQKDLGFIKSLKFPCCIIFPFCNTASQARFWRAHCHSQEKEFV